MPIEPRDNIIILHFLFIFYSLFLGNMFYEGCQFKRGQRRPIAHKLKLELQKCPTLKG
jgi:hypothetical protein